MGRRRGRQRAGSGMEAAFLLGALLPPPAALALVLAGVGWARARLAADRDEAALVQLVVRHVIRADVRPGFGRTPRGERVELEQRGGFLAREGGVDLHRGHVRAGRALVATLAGHPGAVLDQGAA